MTINEETAVKVEAGLHLNLPNEIVIVDDDIDVLQISYLPKLFERLEAVNICEKRIPAIQTDATIETIDLVSSDTESTVTVRFWCISSVSDVNFVLFLKVISENSAHEDVTSMNFQNDDVSPENAPIIQPILRKNRFNATPLGMSKNVTFKNPLAMTYEFESWNYVELEYSNDANSSSKFSFLQFLSFHKNEMRFVIGSSNNNIATGLQRNFPCESSAVTTHSSTISSTQTGIESVTSESSKAIGKVKIGKINKRKSSHFSNRKMKRCGTSIDNWMKRKKLFADPTAELTTQSGITEESSASVVKEKKFNIKLKRLDPLTGQSVEKESVESKTVLTVDSPSNLASKFEKGFILLERMNTLESQYRQTAKSFSFKKKTNCERTTEVKNTSTSKSEDVTTISKLTVNLCNQHSITPQLEMQTSKTISEPLLSDSRVENPMTSQTQPEITSDANHCKSVSVMKEVSTCSPDTTMSSTPPNILLTDVDTEVQTENDVVLNAGNSDLNSNKCIQMACDDCDNDIPSPMYSPYNGNHKNVTDKRSKYNIAANHFSLVLTESQTDDNTITPIVN